MRKNDNEIKTVWSKLLLMSQEVIWIKPAYIFLWSCSYIWMSLFLRVSFLKTLFTHPNLFTSTDLVPERGKILSTDDWSKSWKISFELKVNAQPAAHQNILHVSDPNGALVVSLYVAPSEALEVHHGGKIHGPFPLTVGSFQRLEVQQFLVVSRVGLRCADMRIN